MTYTLLRVVEEGVVLYEEHARRLAPAGREVSRAFERFAREAEPGVYALRAASGRLAVERRSGVRLVDGMPVRFAVSPHAAQVGPLPKPAPPSPYDPLRLPGVCTLLTSQDGLEILEACSAAVVGWEKARFVVPPLNRPRVASTSESALRARFDVALRPIERAGPTPLALLNAVKGTCLPDVGGREPFPPHVRQQIEELLRELTVRPR